MVRQSNDDRRKTTLRRACERGDLATVISVLGPTAQPQRDELLANPGRKTLLMRAARCGSCDVVSALLSFKAEIDAVEDDRGSAALHFACRKGRSEVAALLLDNHASLEQQTFDGATPLVVACYKGHLNVVQLLLERGASTLKTKEFEATALLMACQSDHPAVVETLLTFGADVNEEGSDGVSPLCLAAQIGNLQIARMLVDAGANIHSRRPDGASALDLACSFGNFSIAEILIHHKADVEPSRFARSTPLISACRCGNLGAVELLIRNGANVNGQAPVGGDTPLSMACVYQHTEVVIALLRLGASPNLTSSEGTPLLVACVENAADIVQELLNANADVNMHSMGTYPLNVVSALGHAKMARLLLEHKACVDAPNSTGRTSLLEACEEGSIAVAKCLLDAKADIDKGDLYRTPLMAACRGSTSQLARMLVRRGASFCGPAICDISVIDLARGNHSVFTCSPVTFVQRGLMIDVYILLMICQCQALWKIPTLLLGSKLCKILTKCTGRASQRMLLCSFHCYDLTL